MKNIDIRDAVSSANLKLWMLADALNLRDNELSRRLRYEFAPADKKRAFDAIERLKAERGV